MLPPSAREAIDRIGRDRQSGATALVSAGVAVLRDLASDPASLLAAARLLCLQQPAMAGFRTAAAIALSDEDPERALELLGEQLRRTIGTVARHAVPVLRLRRAPTGAIRVVTCSRSAAVERTILDLARAEPVQVSCSESKPGGEGAELARALADAGIPVDLHSDAGISSAVAGADSLLVGADAIGTAAFINKAGTAALAALARASGVPVFVLAGRDRIVPEPVFASMLTSHSNPIPDRKGPLLTSVEVLFERISAELVSQYITDGGPVAPGDISAAGMWSERALTNISLVS